jgi:hypothetical protein
MTKIDATRPLYAVVGATDLAVEYARKSTADVQARFAKIELPKLDLSKVELEPKALGDQARTFAAARMDELSEDAKEARSAVESYVNEAVAEVTETYGDLAQRGQRLVARIRRQQATQDAKAAAKTTTAKAKTTKTQTKKSAKSTAGTAKRAAKTTSTAAKKTGSTAKSNVKSTTTAAKKTAEATTKAASDAAEKVGD